MKSHSTRFDWTDKSVTTHKIMVGAALVDFSDSLDCIRFTWLYLIHFCIHHEITTKINAHGFFGDCWHFFTPDSSLLLSKEKKSECPTNQHNRQFLSGSGVKWLNSHTWLLVVPFFYFCAVNQVSAGLKVCLKKSYHDLLNFSNDVSIHQKHLLFLAIKVYKSVMNINPECMWELF